MIIQALPSTGKTWLAQQHPNTWVDSDVLLTIVAGDKTKEAFDRMLDDETLRDAMAKLIKTEVVDPGKHLATNFDTTPFGYRPDLIVRLRAADYIDHIGKVGRTDLLDSFSESTLVAWTQPSEEIPTIFLEPGQHLSDITAMMHIA